MAEIEGVPPAQGKASSFEGFVKDSYGEDVKNLKPEEIRLLKAEFDKMQGAERKEEVGKIEKQTGASEKQVGTKLKDLDGVEATPENLAKIRALDQHQKAEAEARKDRDYEQKKEGEQNAIAKKANEPDGKNGIKVTLEAHTNAMNESTVMLNLLKELDGEEAAKNDAEMEKIQGELLLKAFRATRVGKVLEIQESTFGEARNLFLFMSKLFPEKDALLRSGTEVTGATVARLEQVGEALLPIFKAELQKPNGHHSLRSLFFDENSPLAFLASNDGVQNRLESSLVRDVFLGKRSLETIGFDRTNGVFARFAPTQALNTKTDLPAQMAA